MPYSSLNPRGLGRHDSTNQIRKLKTGNVNSNAVKSNNTFKFDAL